MRFNSSVWALVIRLFCNYDIGPFFWIGVLSVVSVGLRLYGDLFFVCFGVVSFSQCI